MAAAKVVGHVAVLGGGIMGACLALNLARHGFRVSLFEAEEAPFTGASRWNEGKIHLGYLYSADTSLQTARRLLPGGLSFARLVSEIIEEPVACHANREGDIYLIHRQSVVGVDEAAAYYDAVSGLIRDAAGAGDYLCDLTAARSRRLSVEELQQVANPNAVEAGFAVPERSVNTRWIADRLCAALYAEPKIELRLGDPVADVARMAAIDGPWIVRTKRGGSGKFDWVINALWQGRIGIDLTAGLQPEPGWSHRYRVSVFARTSRALDVPNAIAAVGPFGDVKNYDGHNFYVSWYPAGLLDESEALTPTRPPALNADRQAELTARIQEGISSVVPAADAIFEAAESLQLNGGFIFALGRGSLAEPNATVHRRDRFGVRRRGRYISVDTGKYSAAPLLAQSIAAEIAGS